MKSRADAIPIGSEAFHTLFEKRQPALVEQAVSAGLVEYFLELLETELVGVDSPSATKALIVKTLKAIKSDIVCGQQVCENLHSVCLLVCLSVGLSVCLSVRPSVCLPVCWPL